MNARVLLQIARLAALPKAVCPKCGSEDIGFMRRAPKAFSTMCTVECSACRYKSEPFPLVGWGPEAAQ